jgi:glutamyl-tRNA reductase
MSDAMVLEYAPVGVFREAAVTPGRTADLPLFVIGLNHRTAPLEVRERLSVAEQKLPDVVRAIGQLPRIAGACVVSTCNRVEVIVSATAETAVDSLHDSVIEWLADHARVRRDELEPHLYVHRGVDALQHLFRVASGLDSMIVGEPQIAGQVKKAFTISREAGALDPLLHQVFEQTMRAAKKVRTETAIGEHAVSVPYAAVELAKKIFSDLGGLRVLLLGAGEMGELTAEHLASHSVKQIFVANKTYERAVELAHRFQGTAVQFAAFEEHLAECDIVIASTAAPHFVIDRAQIHRALAARKQRALFLIDLSVPRNIDPAIGEIEGAYLYNVDDLQQVAAANRALRHQSAGRAQEIIAVHVESFRKRLVTQDAVPTILELQSRLDQIRAAELEKCLRKLGPISVEQRDAIEQLTLQMVNKILHHPIVHLKESSKEPQERESLQRAVRMIFGLM